MLRTQVEAKHCAAASRSSPKHLGGGHLIIFDTQIFRMNWCRNFTPTTAVKSTGTTGMGRGVLRSLASALLCPWSTKGHSQGISNHATLGCCCSSDTAWHGSERQGTIWNSNNVFVTKRIGEQSVVPVIDEASQPSFFLLAWVAPTFAVPTSQEYHEPGKKAARVVGKQRMEGIQHKGTEMKSWNVWLGCDLHCRRQSTSWQMAVPLRARLPSCPSSWPLPPSWRGRPSSCSLRASPS